MAPADLSRFDRIMCVCVCELLSMWVVRELRSACQLILYQSDFIPIQIRFDFLLTHGFIRRIVYFLHAVLRHKKNHHVLFVSLFVLQKLILSEGGEIFNLWQDPPVNIYIKIYLWNITNSEEFLSGKEKMRVEEVGPYVYR